MIDTEQVVALKDLTRVKLGPGDVLVVKVPPDRVPRDPQTGAFLMSEFLRPLREVFGADRQIVVVEDYVELAVIQRSAVEIPADTSARALRASEMRP